MKYHSDNTWGITKAELILAMGAGAILQTTTFTAELTYRGRKLCPRMDTVRKMISHGDIIHCPNNYSLDSCVKRWQLSVKEPTDVE